MEKEQLIPNAETSLGVITAAIFLAGEMAGSGVLALPAALIGTGWSGLLLIAFFSLNAAYIGSRLGLCWEVLAESGFDELNQPHVRDPYPLIAEKAGSIKGPLVAKALRHIASGILSFEFVFVLVQIVPQKHLSSKFCRSDFSRSPNGCFLFVILLV